MAEVILNDELIGQGEPFFALYVDKAGAGGGTIVGELVMDLVGPALAEVTRPRRLSGFERPALEIVQLAHARAQEEGVGKILLVDPQGLLSLAKINRYAPRG